MSQSHSAAAAKTATTAPAAVPTQAPKGGNVVGSIAPATALTLKGPALDLWRFQQNHTQAGNGERLIAARGERLRFHSEKKHWLRWNTASWEVDEKGKTAKDLLAEVRKLGAIDPQFANRSQEIAQFKGALEFATNCQTPSGKPVRVVEKELNRNVDLVPVKNGVIDLRAGVCRKGNPADLFTKVLNVSYDATAQCPAWLKFLDAACCGDQQLVRWLQVFLGHCLTGRVESQCFVWLYGDGGNGKGVLTRVLGKLFAEFAVTTPATTFSENASSDSNAPTPELAGFAGARLVTASETNAEVAVDNAFIKWTTGGDTLKGRFLNCNPFEFEPTHKTIVSTNHLPRINNIEDALVRRVRVVPLKARFARSPGHTGPVTPPTFKSESELFDEMPGILNWLIAGAKAWYDAGADKFALEKAAPCPAIEAESAHFVTGQDSKKAFFIACTEDVRPIPPDLDLHGNPVSGTGRPAGKSVRARDLYAAYLGWCDEQGSSATSKNAFGRFISEKGYELEYSDGGIRRGLGLNTEGERLAIEGRVILDRQKGKHL